MRNTRKRQIAGTVAILGVAGLALSAAASLDLIWKGNFEVGAVTVTGQCQGAEQVTTGFGTPTFDGAADLPWTVETLEFRGIAPACHGLNYEIAVKTDDAWLQKEPGIVDGTTIATTLEVNADDIKEVALTLYN